jgi:hypothetical protein
MDKHDNDAIARSRDQHVSGEAVSEQDDFDFILLGAMEERQGSTPGNMRVRMTLPRHQPFHRIREGVLDWLLGYARSGS